MVDFEQILERNYEEFFDLDIVGRVKDFIFDTDSLMNSTPHFAKVLTKVGERVYELRPTVFDDNYLERLFQFNLEGVILCRGERKAQGYISLNGKLEAHFYGHAGNVSMFLWERTHDLDWLKISFETKKTSGERSSILGKSYSSHGFSLAATRAHMIHGLTGLPVWEEECYNLNLRAANIIPTSRKKHRKHAIFCYNEAGRAAEELALMDNRELWTERSYRAYLEGAHLSEGYFPGLSGRSYGSAAKNALSLYELTGLPRWAKLSAYTAERYCRYEDPNKFMSMGTRLDMINSGDTTFIGI